MRVTRSSSGSAAQRTWHSYAWRGTDWRAAALRQQDAPGSHAAADAPGLRFAAYRPACRPSTRKPKQADTRAGTMEGGGGGGGGKGGGKGGGGRDGDWRCSACNNINFSFRTNCNRCQSPRYATDGGDQVQVPPGGGASGGKGGGGRSGVMPGQGPGDWRCPSCNNINFSFRRACNRCQAPKPDDAGMGGGGGPVQGEALQHLALRAPPHSPSQADPCRPKANPPAPCLSLLPRCPTRPCEHPPLRPPAPPPTSPLPVTPAFSPLLRVRRVVHV